MCIELPGSPIGKAQWMLLPRRQSGLSLFELLFFMVIVSIGLAGILSVMDLTTRHSADPLQRKQALAIAEAILEEVQLLPVAEDSCAGLQGEEAMVCRTEQGSGAAASQQRDSADSPFTVVDHYNGLNLEGGTGGESAAVAIPAGYHVKVAVAPASLGPDSASVKDDAARLITVTVGYDQGREKMVLQGYRGSYDAPETP